MTRRLRREEEYKSGGTERETGAVVRSTRQPRPRRRNCRRPVVESLRLSPCVVFPFSPVYKECLFFLTAGGNSALKPVPFIASVVFFKASRSCFNASSWLSALSANSARAACFQYTLSPSPPCVGTRMGGASGGCFVNIISWLVMWYRDKKKRRRFVSGMRVQYRNKSRWWVVDRPYLLRRLASRSTCPRRPLRNPRRHDTFLRLASFPSQDA
jgi:hypothetical protein